MLKYHHFWGGGGRPPLISSPRFRRPCPKCSLRYHALHFPPVMIIPLSPSHHLARLSRALCCRYLGAGEHCGDSLLWSRAEQSVITHAQRRSPVSERVTALAEGEMADYSSHTDKAKPCARSELNVYPSVSCASLHRRSNGRGHGGHGPLTFQSKLFLKSFLSFLNTIFIRKMIHQDEESTTLRRNLSQRG